MKLLTVIGARPQFIKASAVSRAIQAENACGVDLHEVIVHTGQHFDDDMSLASNLKNKKCRQYTDEHF